MSEQSMATVERPLNDSEAERRQRVEQLTASTNAVLERQLRREGGKFDEAQSAEISLHEKDDGVDARFKAAFLQREDHLDGWVRLERTVTDEGEVRYSLDRPGYNNATLEYHWTEGGGEVKKGYSEGFYYEREGREPGYTKAGQRPSTLTAEDIAGLDGMILELNDTHEGPKKPLGKVRSGMARLALGRFRR